MFNNLKRSSLALIVITLLSMAFSSCHIKQEAHVKTISGTATISKNPVKIGDEVYLSIGAVKVDANGDIDISISASQENGQYIGGKEIGIPNVKYYIDKKYVGSSNDKSKKFAYKYVVSDLSAGKHTLSAIPEPQDDETVFSGSYDSTTFTVEAN